MPTFGLSTTGFTPKTFEDLVEEVNADLRAAFGNSVNLTNGIMARFRDIVCERYAELWEELETVYSSQDPGKATDAALEALCALTGTLKNAATASTVTLALTGTPATLVNAGSRATVVGTGKKFATDAAATIALVPVWSGGSTYPAGARVSNDSKVYQCKQSGTSAAGPTGTGVGIVDGGCTWDYLGGGTGAVDVTATCTETGVNAAYARDISVIDTPVGGWQGVINVTDALLGTAIETNEELRIRRELELSRSGASTPDAIRASMLDVEDVTACTVFINNTDTTDADGIPPHAVECLVRGGEDQAIFDALLANVAAGIATHGTLTGTALDSQLTAHTMKFTRPDGVEISVALTILYDAKLYPSNGDQLVKESIVAWGALQDTGKDVVSSAVLAQAFKVTGVLDISLCNISLYPASPSSNATIPISLRQLALFDTGRITITSTPATP